MGLLAPICNILAISHLLTGKYSSLFEMVVLFIFIWQILFILQDQLKCYPLINQLTGQAAFPLVYYKFVECL